MSRPRPLRLLAWLALLTSTAAAETVPVGDGGSQALVFESRSVHPQSVRIQAGEAGIDAPVEPFQRVVVVAQCLGEPTPLHGGLGDADDPLDVPTLAFPDGPPALWIHRERAGRAALEKRVQEVRPGLTLRHLTPAEVPLHFAALRFAPLILIEINDWAELGAAQQGAIRGAVAAGAVLVLGGGDGTVPADAVAPVISVQAGTAERAGPALTSALQRASGHRVLTPGPGAVVRIVADGAPVLVDAPHGLGQVRVAAVRLTEIDAGAVAQALFAEPPDALGSVLAWLQGAPALTEARAAPSPPTPGTCWPRWRLAPSPAGCRASPSRAPCPRPHRRPILPPPPTGRPAPRVLYVPAGDQALAVGTLDVTLQRAAPTPWPPAPPRSASTTCAPAEPARCSPPA
ncbi:MAG: hypothetical protein R3F60_05025 [bacterium]